MGRLLLLNGLPGSGKSTLAARYVADRPLSLCLDIDVVREMLGSWQDTPSRAGQRARRLALSMAREVLCEGQDVVVPQLLARSEFLDRLEALSERSGAEFREVWLRLEPERAVQQLRARAAGPMSSSQRSAHVMLERDGGAEEVLPLLHRRLLELQRRRPGARSLSPVPGDVEATYRALLALLDAPPDGETRRTAEASHAALAPVIALSVADAGELLTLQRAAYVSEARLHDDPDLPPLTESLEAVRAALERPDMRAWGVREHGRLVAAVRVAVRVPRAELGRLVAAPDRQREGLGSRLLRHAEERLPAAVTSIGLFTGERSASNLRLYRRHGYREMRRTSAGGYDLVHLEKPLPRPAAP